VLAASRRRARARNAQLKHALHAARVIAWTYDVRRRLITYELSAEAFGIRPPPGPLTPRKAIAYVHPKDRRAVWGRMRSAIQRAEPFVHHFQMLASKSAAPIWVEGHAAPVREKAGRARKVTGALIDITAHKRAADAMADMDRRKDEFLATLAHELRSPLASLRTAAHLLQGAQLDAEQARTCIGMIQRQTWQLTRLTDDLLDIGRITHRRLVLHREVADLQGIVSDSVDTIRSLADARGQQLNVGTALLEPTYIDADRSRMMQVFCNLLTNAIKYTPIGGRIQVMSEREANRAVVRVRDTGIGIPPDQQARVFEPFYQVEGATESSPGGLGIGLALVRQIIGLHGGTVDLQSAGTGHGSEFRISLPLVAAPPADVIRLERTVSSQAQRAMHVLLADDNPDLAQSMAMALRLLGHEVRVASDGAEAIRIADEFRPEVALLDLGMPHLRGDQVARVLRSRAWAQHIVLIALTGWNPRDLAGRIDLSPFDSHLVKPTEIETLEGVIHGISRRPSNGVAPH
jgi:signal transduction histidine kinase/CheY-like chemotaxis protein